MNTASEIAHFGLAVLKPILDQSGYVLYSDAASLKQAPVYLLGHNPGGSPEEQAQNTVRKSLEAMPTKSFNNYIDEAWQTASGRCFAIGQAPLQRRVIWLLTELDLRVHEVPSSNLVFSRSIDVAGSSFHDLADLCWSVHEKILSVVKPRVLLVFGNSNPSPYTYLLSRFSATAEDTCESGHGNWMCRAFRSSNGLTVIGLPHLSRYNIIDKPEVVAWIRDYGAL